MKKHELHCHIISQCRTNDSSIFPSMNGRYESLLLKRMPTSREKNIYMTAKGASHHENTYKMSTKIIHSK